MSAARRVPRHRRNVPVRVALVVCSLALMVTAGCAPDANDTRAATAGMPDLLQQLTAHTWLLDPAASSPSVPAGTVLTFGDTHAVTGIGPCNPYRGVVVIDDFTLRIERLRAEPTPPGSMAPCTPDAVAAEERYLRALATVRDVDATDRKRLVLTGADGVQLTFNAVTNSFEQ